MTDGNKNKQKLQKRMVNQETTISNTNVELQKQGIERLKIDVLVPLWQAISKFIDDFLYFFLGQKVPPQVAPIVFSMIVSAVPASYLDTKFNNSRMKQKFKDLRHIVPSFLKFSTFGQACVAIPAVFMLIGYRIYRTCMNDVESEEPRDEGSMRKQMQKKICGRVIELMHNLQDMSMSKIKELMGPKLATDLTFQLTNLKDGWNNLSNTQKAAGLLAVPAAAILGRKIHRNMQKKHGRKLTETPDST